jgi:hypothetical protein
MTRRIDVCIHNPLEFQPVFLTTFLSENRVNRRRSSVECKRKKSLRPRRRIKDLNSGYDGGDSQCHRRLGNLDSYVRRDTERAVRMRDIANWMGVNSLNCPCRQNKQHAKQRKEDSPGALHIRFWPKAEHDKSNIARNLHRKTHPQPPRPTARLSNSLQRIENEGLTAHHATANLFLIIF